MSCNGKTKIPDRNFLSHEKLNMVHCVASDRFLQKVPEFVKVISVCQDELNTSIVYMEFELNGVFDYTPSIAKGGSVGCMILSVDGDTSFETNRVVAPLMLEYHRNNPKSLPLNTECKTRTFILAFDFGRVIPEFLGSKEIHFRLRMEGVLPSRLNFQKFLSLETSVKYDYRWNKGPTPNPYRMDYDTDRQKLLVYFQFEQGVPCHCNILCESISGSSDEVQYCEDKTSRVIVDYSAGVDPGKILLQFSDGFGNISDLNIQPLIEVLPVSPQVYIQEKPRRAEIGVNRMSVGGTKLDDGTAYQIWKYDQSISNARIWKDWSYRDYSSFSDVDIIPGRTYGYAVRYRGPFGEESKLSGWSTVKA
jgi:hypothetical protein|tara:strand:+ start:605 stop:1693 length:1089 start_codon:yes stop_codon:yes gene_type:complete